MQRLHLWRALMNKVKPSQRSPGPRARDFNLTQSLYKSSTGLYAPTQINSTQLQRSTPSGWAVWSSKTPHLPPQGIGPQGEADSPLTLCRVRGIGPLHYCAISSTQGG
ncbi:hypothetical protein FKM82_025371 [Ascaphus truei]